MLFSRLLTTQAQQQAAEKATAAGKVKAVTVMAPLNGRVIPLDEMPSAVFTQRLLGEGVAMEPSGYQVFSPIAGKVEKLDSTGEQIRIKNSSGLQVLIHIGTDTKRLMGESVKFHAKEGSSVALNAPLLDFNLTLFKRNLPSTLVAITVLNSNKTKGIIPHYRSVLAKEDSVFTVYI